MDKVLYVCVNCERERERAKKLVISVNLLFVITLSLKEYMLI